MLHNGAHFIENRLSYCISFDNHLEYYDFYSYKSNIINIPFEVGKVAKLRTKQTAIIISRLSG